MKEQCLRFVIFSSYLNSISSVPSMETTKDHSLFKIYSDRMISHGELLDLLLSSYYHPFFPIKKFKKVN